MRHYTGKHNVLDIWTNEFLAAVNSEGVTPAVMCMVENVNFYAQKGSVQKLDSARHRSETPHKKSGPFKCVLCKEVQSFNSR